MQTVETHCMRSVCHLAFPPHNAPAGGVVTIMINNPKAMNTFSRGVTAGVMQALEMCADDHSGEEAPVHHTSECMPLHSGHEQRVAKGAATVA